MLKLELAAMAIAGSVAAATTSGPTGAWEIADNASEPQPRPWDYSATLKATKGAELYVSCGASGTSLWINWPGEVRADSSDRRTAFVTWALDGQGARKTAFLVGKDDLGNAGTHLAPASALKWFGALEAGKTLVVRVGAGPGGQTATFHLKGVRVVAATFNARNCGAR